MSDFQSILLHLDASARSAVRVALARELASRHGATVKAMYAATSSALQTPHVLVEGGAAYPRAEVLDAERRQRARAIFDAANPGTQVRWAELHAAAVIPGFMHEALGHDLVVLGQHDPADAESHVVPANFPEAVVLGSAKPVIIVPRSGDFRAVANTVVIAWKPTREAARAVDAAMPILQRAGNVHVAGWDSEPRELEDLLQRRGVQAIFHREQHRLATVGAAILSLASRLDADLLVMGCYGHSRARELVLGGATRTVLDEMTLPVLMAH